MRRVVLDTNVLLDCWVFDNVAARPLRAALESGRVRAVRSFATESEFADVIARPPFALAEDTRARLLATWRGLAEYVAQVDAAPPALRCTDRDDQIFLDLACAARADTLVTRDKALLATARRARAFGLVVCSPETAASMLLIEDDGT